MTEPVAAEPTASKAKRILVVDDEVRVVQFVKINLEQAGYKVETAENESQALAKIKTVKPDLLVVEAFMRESNGFELMEVICSDAEIEEIPTLLMEWKCAVVYTETEIEAKAKWFASLSIDRRIEKPFSPDQLRAVVDDMLAKSPAEDKS